MRHFYGQWTNPGSARRSGKKHQLHDTSNALARHIKSAHPDGKGTSDCQACKEIKVKYGA